MIAAVGERARAMILEFEGLDQPWDRPPGDSGITIGHGWDLGYYTVAELDDAWGKHLSAKSMALLRTAVGLKGAAAEAIEHSMLKCERITREAAGDVFAHWTLPRWRVKAAEAFPGLDALTADQQGALVSLVFNRGASMDGPRRTEMRANRAILASDRPKKAALIAEQILAMRRLWPELLGLRRRRSAEAQLFMS